ncbi:asparagine synthase (glutamine-hydrolyzing) [Vibrio comitans]
MFKAMGDSIRHRGPDGQGIHYDHNQYFALGNQRLAILDLEHGDQPFYSDSKDIIVVQNGEIFNHVELANQLAEDGYPCKTNCDTETILRLYERDGISGISSLNGMFAIAIYDKRIDAMFLIRDRVGEKPLHFCLDNNRLVFASEIKALLKAVTQVKLDEKALHEFLSFNYVPMPNTMFSGVFHVKPGHYLKVDTKGVEEAKWWDLSSITQQARSETSWIADFNSILEDSVKIRLRSDVPFGAFLSGGVDSSSVVGIMSKHMKQKVKTYCIGFNDPKYDESPFAETAAERFGTEHKLRKVEPNLLSEWSKATYHCDQPHGDVSFLPTLKVAELASEDVKMVLTGDGADELFAGYDKYKDFFHNHDTTKLDSDDFAKLYAKNISLFTKNELNTLLKNSPESHPDYCQERVKSLIDEVPHMDRVNQALYIDTQLLLSGNNLVKPDRMGMAVSIENRAPFLDYRMIELAFSMPGELKLSDGETKYIYKKAVSPLIGSDLAYRKKQMFTVPVGEWFKDSMKEYCKELLFSADSVLKNYVNEEEVSDLFEKHCNNIENNTRKIRALLALELWCREFLSDDIAIR